MKCVSFMIVFWSGGMISLFTINQNLNYLCTKQVNWG